MKATKFLSVFCAAAMLVSAGALNVCAAADNETAAAEEESASAPVFDSGVWELSTDGKAMLYLVFTSPTEGHTERADGTGGVPFSCEQDGYNMVFHFGGPDDNTLASCSEGDAEITFTMEDGTEQTYQIDHVPCDDPASFSVEAADDEEAADDDEDADYEEDVSAEDLIDLEDALIKVDTVNKTVSVYVGDELIPESAYTLRFFFHLYTEDGESLSLSGMDYPNQPGTYIATITPNEGYTGEARSEEFIVTSAANGGGITADQNPSTGAEGFAASLVLAGICGAAAVGAVKLRRNK